MEELKKKSDKELDAFLSEKRVALHNFKFGIAGSKVRNMKEGKGLRKEIAQALTEKKVRKIGQ